MERPGPSFSQSIFANRFVLTRQTEPLAVAADISPYTAKTNCPSKQTRKIPNNLHIEHFSFTKKLNKKLNMA